MARLSLILILLLSLAAPATAAPPRPQLPSLDATEEAQLAQGKTVLQLSLDGEGGGFVTGIAEIAASHDTVWDVLVAFERIPESTPGMKEAKRYLDRTAADGAREIGVSYLLKVAWVEVRYHIFHRWFPDQHYLVWNLDESKPNDIVETVGSFSTWPGSKPGTVRFLYQTRVRTGRSIPKWVEEDLSVTSVKRYIRFVKDQAER